jgi:endoglucanase
MDRVEKLLKALTELPGISGQEHEVAQFMEMELKGIVEAKYDGLGSFIGIKKGKSERPRIMIAGHMDEIGFMVRGITKEGFIKFNTVGGWWEHQVLGQRVIIYTKKGPVYGVIGSESVHKLDPKEREKVIEFDKMFIDIGVTADTPDLPKKLGIRPGDPIVPASEFRILSNKKMYLAKAWDDRIGVAVVIEVLRELSKREHPNTVYGVGTVQEEVGLRGATTSSFAVEPDIGFAVDVTIAGDFPGSKDAEISEKCGAGPSLSVIDGSLIPNPRLRDFVIDVAEELKIPYQLGSLARGGTDGGRIQLARSGVPTMTLSIATRYIHTHQGILHRDDFDNLVKLLVEVIARLDKKAVDKIRYN